MPDAPESPEPIRLADKLDQVTALWTPHRIARFDGHQMVLARVDGEFVWHQHDGHDEVFLPLSGELWIDFEDAEARRVLPGEVLVVPAGTRHRPRTEGGEVTMLVIDPMDVRHTGEVTGERTVEEYPEI
ncbi:MAG: cupin domain-containing protein [Planctomycetota bacterium]